MKFYPVFKKWIVSFARISYSDELIQSLEELVRSFVLNLEFGSSNLNLVRTSGCVSVAVTKTGIIVNELKDRMR